MTGMKEGAGEDPFADDDSSETEATERSSADAQSSPDDPVSETGDRQRHGQQQMQIPYKFRRDGVQDGRDRVPLFLHTETKRAERDGLRELEDRFDDNVSLTDLREALVKVGLSHLDEVEAHLEEWGYGMTFDD
jgi:hypothetical protein